MRSELLLVRFFGGDIQDYGAWDLWKVSFRDPQSMSLIMGQIEQLLSIDTQCVNAMDELLFMAVAFLNNVAEANRILETEQLFHLQSRISNYLFWIKQNETPIPYPYREEKLFLQALGKGAEQLALALLNELLGPVMFESDGNMEQIDHRVHELLIVSSRTVIDSGGNPLYVDEFMKTTVKTSMKCKQ